MVARLQLLLTLLSVSTMAVGGGVLATGPDLDGPTEPVDVVEQVDETDLNESLPTDPLAGNRSDTNGSANESNGSDAAAVDTDVDSVDRTRKSNVRVDDTVILVDYRWDSDAEVFRLTFESDRPRGITVTESVQQPEGAGTFEIRQERLEKGLTELALPAEPTAGEVAVSITTPASIRQGKGVYVSTGITQQGGPWSVTGSEAGWFGGLSVALSMMVAAAWNVKRRTDDEPEQLT